MQRAAIYIAVLLLIANWGNITRFFNPPPDYSLEHNGKVILYATDWCGYCEKTRKLLKANNIPYYEYDIEKSFKGKDQYDSLGGRGVPVLLIKGEVIHGFNKDRILSLAGPG